MTVEELRWKLKDYDSDTPVQVIKATTREFGEPHIEVIWAKLTDRFDGQEREDWVIQLK